MSVAMDTMDRLGQAKGRVRDLLETWVKQKIYFHIARVVDRIPGVAKDLIEDEQMPRVVSRSKDRLLDALWPDVREEIMWEVAVLLDGQKEEDQIAVNVAGVCSCLAFLRYHYEPYDKTIWGKLRDPFWWMYSLISMVPVYGASPFTFFLIFLIIDKSDEFQLIAFILKFKGTQFISHGIIRAITGYTMFMMCATAPAHEDQHDCEDRGPGSEGNFWITSASFLMYIVLVWAAFVMLPFSKEKGRRELNGKVEHEHAAGSRQPGGLILPFLFYDVIAFVLCLMIVVYTITTRPDYRVEDWPVRHAIYAAQVLYGFMSFPFFLFTLPLLQQVLTHAYPTAYDRGGRCVRPFKKPKSNKAKSEEVVSEGETLDFISKLKELMVGEASAGGGARSSGDSV